MKLNFKTEIGDVGRRHLASLMAGKPVKRLATRSHVKEFLEGILEALGVDPTDQPTPTPALKGGSLYSFLRDTHGDPRLEGKSTGYIVGYNKVKFQDLLANKERGGTAARRPGEAINHNHDDALPARPMDQQQSAHFVTDVSADDVNRTIQGQSAQLLHSSPACIGHSKAME